MITTAVSPTLTIGGSSASASASATSGAAVASSAPNLTCTQVYTNSRGVSYLILCNTNYGGTIISTQPAKHKRATADDALLNCLQDCDYMSDCVATSYDSTTTTCTFFSSVGTPYSAESVDFAMVDNTTASSTGSTSTSSSGSTVSTAASTDSSVSSTTYAVAGGSAAGQGLQTSLLTASTTYSTKATDSVYTSSNASTTVTSTSTATTATALSTGAYTDWTTYVGNGVNMGNWLEIEQSNNQYFWNLHAPNASDEWTWCETLGSECGTVLEDHYATAVTTKDIDTLASVGQCFRCGKK